VIFGIVTLLVYFFIDRQIGIEDPNPSPTSKDRIELEYATLNSEVQRRGDLLASHGRIFIAASFVLLGAAANIQNTFTRPLLVWFTLTIYLVFLFFSVLPSRMLDSIALARLRGIEQCVEPTFEVHCFMLNEIKDNKKNPNLHFWVSWRRRLWMIFLAIIIIFGSFIQLNAAYS